MPYHMTHVSNNIAVILVGKHYTVNPYAAGGYFCLYKMMQKTWKMTETLAHGHSTDGI